MKIQCPECDHAMSVGRAKAGTYKPKCKSCGKSFALKVSGDDPPKVRVAKLKRKAAAKVSAAATAATVDLAATAATSDPAATGNPAATAATIDPAATMDSVGGGGDAATRASAAEATVEPSAMGSASVSAGAASVSGTTVRPGPSATVKPGPSATVRPGPSATVKPRPGATAGTGRVKPESDEVPARLGGYRVVRLLGRGAMGEVFEARQVSLDRQVALKRIRGAIARRPSALARFTREAYAASRLAHHNVVQIYDFGNDSGEHFFSMEWVRGGPLDDVVKEDGPLESRVAATYILQAARGLQAAHNLGMTHRDIKPANLLLSSDGTVKVADLGLVKIPDLEEVSRDTESGSALSGAASGTEVTMHGSAVGTPAYMAPEQCNDAASADHRADIYSLGCTLFFLLTGRPPFAGSNVSEVIDAQINRTAPDVTQVQPNVAPEVADVVRRCLAKSPEDRYPSVADLIDDLEGFLNLKSDGGFRPTAEQADRWEVIAKRYAAARSTTSLVTPIAVAGSAGAALLVFLTPWLGWRMLPAGPVAAVTAIALYFGLSATAGRPAVVDRVRAYVASQSWLAVIAGGVAAVLGLVITLVVGFWLGLLVGLVLGAAFGALLHVLAGVVPAKKSFAATEDARRFVRDLRLAGADEDALQDFTARHGGKAWQPLFESLFGYDDLVRQRRSLAGDRSFRDGTRGGVRDWICGGLDRRAAANREASDAAKLAKVEKAGLKAEGLTDAEAEERAHQLAAAVMDASAAAPVGGDAKATVEAKRAKMKAMLAEARSGKYKRKRDPLAPIKRLLGGPARLAAGLALLAGFAVAGRAAGLFDSMADIDVSGVVSGNLDSIGDVAGNTLSAAKGVEAEAGIAGRSFDLWSVGVAGLLLTLSSFVAGWRMTLFAVPATLVILFGPSLGIPAIGGWIPAWAVAAGAGLAVYVPGVLWGEASHPS